MLICANYVQACTKTDVQEYFHISYQKGAKGEKMANILQ